nr:uncharacterized protein LOC106682593 isoform X2 [Halyomorpha halys]
MDQMVSTSLCGLPLSKAAIAIGVLHLVIFSGFFLYEVAYAFVDWMILFNPPGLFTIIENELLMGMFSSEAFLSCVASVCLVVGAWKAEPGLIVTWLLQQAVLIFSSLLTLFYFVIAAYLKVPLQNCFFELFLNAIQGYFLIVVYAHFQELRKGNLCETNNQLVN